MVELFWKFEDQKEANKDMRVEVSKGDKIHYFFNL